MSGEKRHYVRVDDRELRRLREQDSRLRSIQNDLPERLNAVREQARQEFQQRLAPLEQRARQQEQETKQLRSNIKNLEQETHRRLQKQREEFKVAVQEAEYRQQQALQRETQRLESAMQDGFAQQRREYLRITQEQRQEYTNLIAQQNAKFTQLLDEEKQARIAGQQVLQKQLDVVFNDIERKGKLAEDLLADVEKVWLGIERDYQHQRFAPGRLADLRRNLELAKTNILNGVSEAAIAVTQETYLKLVDLRIELAQKEQEWIAYYNAALSDLRSLIAEVQANREYEFEFGEKDEAEKFKLEVDYWVNGGLSQYAQELQELEEKLIAGEATLTTEELKNIGEQINNLQPKLGEIVEQARLAILGSQIRAEIADNVVETLMKLGYTLVDPDVDAVYEDDDQRKAFIVKVKNYAEDEVVTIISPEKEFGANSISINSFSPTVIDETATQKNAQVIFDALEQQAVKGEEKIQCNASPNIQAEKFKKQRRN